MHTNINILFIIPPYFNASDYLNKEKAAVLPAFTIPYGLLSMEAYLRKNSLKSTNITICDLNITLNNLVESRFTGDYLYEFQKKINVFLKNNIDIVGFSALFNSSAQYIEDLAKFVKSYDEKIITIAGGGLPSADYTNILECCVSLDAVCKGEGEIPLMDLVDAADQQVVLKEHKSWITREDAIKGKIPDHSFVVDLDEIPFFDYNKINLNFYNSRSINKQNIDEVRREMSIHTSRGCPFKCVFCSNPSLHGYDVRVMSVDRVILDVKRMKNEFEMTDLLVEDDHFFNDIGRAKQILIGLGELDIRVEFPNGIAVYAIDDEVSALLSRAGVSVVALAVESGSEFVLNKIIKKPLRKKLIRPAIESLRKYNVKTHVFVVVGLPGETDEHREETYNTLIENEFNWVHVYVAIPIVGSRLYDICIEKGYIEDQKSANYVATKSVIQAPSIDPVKIEEFAYKTQLMVNFVHNSDIKNGRYEIAMNYFVNVCDKYPDHALGHYYLSECYKKTGCNELSLKHKNIANKIFATDEYWQKFYDIHMI